MALAGFDGNLEEEAILVAIDEDLFDFLEMTAFFALFPKLFAGAGKVDGEAGFNSQIEGFFVHISEHQDPAGFGILSDDGYKAVFVELRRELNASLENFFIYLHFRFLTGLKNYPQISQKKNVFTTKFTKLTKSKYLIIYLRVLHHLAFIIQIFEFHS